MTKTECCREARFWEFFRRVLYATLEIFMYGYCFRVFSCVISSRLLGLSLGKMSTQEWWPLDMSYEGHGRVPPIIKHLSYTVVICTTLNTASNAHDTFAHNMHILRRLTKRACCRYFFTIQLTLMLVIFFFCASCWYNEHYCCALCRVMFGICAFKLKWSRSSQSAF